MINNRQSSSRRRGRGGSSQQRTSGSSSGQRDSGNRIDSRSRGNAAQLLEKYKNMARDAQMSGDRVQTEYYLQFADHYFRVLADSRARSDDHRPIRPVDDFDGSDEEYGDEGEPIRSGEQGDGRQSTYQQPQYQQPQYQPANQSAREQQPRRDDSRRDDGRRDDARREESRRDEPRREDARRDEPRRDDRTRRDSPPRDQARDQTREQVRAEPAPREDRVAEQANGHAYRERVANDLDPAAPVEAPAAEPKTVRRATRTRAKPTVEPAVGLDADRLPPALGIGVSDAAEPAETAAPDGEPKPKRRRRTATPPSEAQAS